MLNAIKEKGKYRDKHENITTFGGHFRFPRKRPHPSTNFWKPQHTGRHCRVGASSSLAAGAERAPFTICPICPEGREKLLQRIITRTSNARDKSETMSGARLCALLGELGFEGAGALDPDSFEWPFQYEDARPILYWICSSLRPSNVLSPSELSQLPPSPPLCSASFSN